jgi:hypothetical protein
MFPHVPARHERHMGGKDEDWRTIRTDDKTFGEKNWPLTTPKFANDRGLGLADMARAIAEQRPHRANGDIALHVLAVMAGISRGGDRRPAGGNLAGLRAAQSPGEPDAKALLKLEY